jgi:hypothetical protein
LFAFERATDSERAPDAHGSKRSSCQAPKNTPLKQEAEASQIGAGEKPTHGVRSSGDLTDAALLVAAAAVAGGLTV